MAVKFVTVDPPKFREVGTPWHDNEDIAKDDPRLSPSVDCAAIVDDFMLVLAWVHPQYDSITNVLLMPVVNFGSSGPRQIDSPESEVRRHHFAI